MAQRHLIITYRDHLCLFLPTRARITNNRNFCILIYAIGKIFAVFIAQLFIAINFHLAFLVHSYPRVSSVNESIDEGINSFKCISSKVMDYQTFVRGGWQLKAKRQKVQQKRILTFGP